MPAIEIDFEWPVDDAGYEVVTPEGPRPSFVIMGTGSSTLPPQIRRKGRGRARRHRPLEINPVLFRQFAELGDDPKAFVEFASGFGLLFHHEDGEGDSVSDWRDEVKKMKTACRLWGQHSKTLFSDKYLHQGLATISAVLRPAPPDGRPVLKLVPHSLRSAMWLQFAQFVSSDRKLRACDRCGAWFEVGSGGKRVTSRFCSDRHRDEFHNAEKRGSRK